MRAVAGAVRRRADDELRLPARSESLSGGEGHVGGGEDRQAGRHDRLRRRMPRRPARRTAPTARCSPRSRRPAALLDDDLTRRATRVPDQWQVQVQAQIQTEGAGAGEDRAASAPDEIRAAHFTPIDDVAARGAGRAATRRPSARRCACCRRAADDSVPARLTAIAPLYNDVT